MANISKNLTIEERIEKVKEFVNKNNDLRCDVSKNSSIKLHFPPQIPRNKASLHQHLFWSPHTSHRQAMTFAPPHCILRPQTACFSMSTEFKPFFLGVMQSHYITFCNILHWIKYINVQFWAFCSLFVFEYFKVFITFPASNFLCLH